MPKRRPHDLDALVLDAVGLLGAPTAREIVRALAERGDAMTETQLYRVLSRLAEAGSVTPVLTGRRFVLSKPGSGFDATLACTGCARVECAPADDMSFGLARIARGHGFVVRHLIVEIAGLCERCGDGSSSGEKGSGS